MHRDLKWLVPVVCAVTACGGQPAGAQSTAPRPADDLARAYVYEVAPEQVATAREPGFIEVTGSGSVMVAPDRAMAAFAVESQAKTAGEASATNAEAMASVVRALRGSDIRGLRVETFGYVLRPDYSYPTVDGVRRRVVDGYTALNNVRVTLDDVAAVGRVIDMAVAAGANRVSSLQFEATDIASARREALTQAVQQARLEAEAIARALGYGLGSPLEVRGGSQQPVPRLDTDLRMRVAAEQAVETPVEAAEQTVRASVSVKFALGAPTGGP